jgi:hypothetical protein
MRARAVFWVLATLSLSLAASSASAALLIKVDKSAQTLTVVRDGRTLHAWPVSTGKAGHKTPSGNFTTFRMEADHFSKEWDDAPMPHSVFFTKQGHAIHGSYDVKRLGSPASHGCVRLAPANAATLFSLVKQEGLPNTQVVLTGRRKSRWGAGECNGPLAARRECRTSRRVQDHRRNLNFAPAARTPCRPRSLLGHLRKANSAGDARALQTVYRTRLPQRASAYL